MGKRPIIIIKCFVGRIITLSEVWDQLQLMLYATKLYYTLVKRLSLISKVTYGKGTQCYVGGLSLHQSFGTANSWIEIILAIIGQDSQDWGPTGEGLRPPIQIKFCCAFRDSVLRHTRMRRPVKCHPEPGPAIQTWQSYVHLVIPALVTTQAYTQQLTARNES